MRKSKEDGETLAALAGLLTEIANAESSSQGLRLFIAEMVAYERQPRRNEGLVRVILGSLLKMLNVTSHREALVFSGGPKSGLGLVTVHLPRDGYGFFGWLRIERQDHDLPRNSKMCIYKLMATKSKEVELYVEDGILHYAVLKKDRDNTVAHRTGREGPACGRRVYAEEVG
jgi:hypothetical protein